MTPADDAQPLQFEAAIPQDGASAALDDPRGVTCRACRQSIADEYFDVNGEAMCASCRDVIGRHGESPRGPIPLARAALFGLAAAVAGAILYYAVIAITNLEIGLVAIAIGYMVGYAIQTGTGGRGGRPYQVMALVLTYWSVGLAYIPLAIGHPAEQKATSAQSDASAGAAPAADQTTQPATPLASDADVNLPLAMAYLFAFSFMLPVMVVFGSLPGGLLSAAIIGFGMHQAWRMTASPQFTITGPFRVGAAGRTAT